MSNVFARIRLVVVYVLIATPFIVNGAFNALQSNNNSPIDWVDDSFAPRRQYDVFVEQFGPGDAVVASWPGCTWDDPRLDQLVRAFREASLFRQSDGSPCFHRVVSGRETLRHMVNPPQANTAAFKKESNAELNQFSAGLSKLQLVGNLQQEAVKGLSGVDFASDLPEELISGQGRGHIPLQTAIDRLKGTLIGTDGKTTCLILYFTTDALARRAELVRLIQKSIIVCCEVPEADVHFAGPVIDGLTVDQASQKSLQTYAAPSALLILFVCWISLRSFRAGLMVFLVAAFCQAGTLAVVHYSGHSLSALLIILPPLIQVLAVAGGIHLTNYYFDAPAEMDATDAAMDAFRKGWMPCLLSSATTAMGTASLMISGLTPIRLFGVYATVGVILTAVTVLTAIPLTLMLTGIRRPRRRPHGKTTTLITGSVLAKTSANNDDNLLPHALPTSVADSPPARHASRTTMTESRWAALCNTLDANATRIGLVLLCSMIGIGFGLPQVQTSVRIETLFNASSRIMQDYQWLESNVGALVPIEVLLQFPVDNQLSPRERMALLQRAEQRLNSISSIHSTTSALTFFPPLPSMKSLPERLKVATVNRAVLSAMPVFESVDVLRETAHHGQIFRLTAHCSAVEPLDYQALTDEIEQRLTQALETLREESGPPPVVTTSEVMPLVQHIQQQLLTDLFKSLMSALVVITITMTVAEAGLFSGLLAMVSNVFPIVILFGLMGLLQVPMDIGSVMTASVALGIAVDDTLHFLTFFRRGLNQGLQRSGAVLFAYHHCGTAMIQTSVSCGLGLLVFSFSDFVPTSRFALLMGSLLMLALLADLVLLPALLLSPLGRMFRTDQKKMAGPLGDP